MRDRFWDWVEVGLVKVARHRHGHHRHVLLSGTPTLAMAGGKNIAWSGVFRNKSCGGAERFVKLRTFFVRQWLFCCRRQFTLRDYFAVSYLWLVNLNDVLNMWLLVVSDSSILKTKKKFCTPRSLSPTMYTPFQCTLPRTFTYRASPSSVRCLSFKALASWDSNPRPWYLKTSALSTTPQCH